MGRTGNIWIRLLATTTAIGLAAVTGASDLAILNGGFHPEFYTEAKLQKDVDLIVADTSAQFNSMAVYKEDGFDEFQEWMDANSADGELDIIWLNGSMPRFMWPEGEPVSRARAWLLGGNMFINAGQTFADQSWECNDGCEINGFAAARDILGLDGDVFVRVNENLGIGGWQVIFKPTEAADQYLPRVCLHPLTTYPFQNADIKGDWEIADAFGTRTGENPGHFSDPAVIHNTKTHGYLCIMGQSGTGGAGLWCARGKPTADFINNWVPANAIGFSVQPRGKLVTRWAELKRYPLNVRPARGDGAPSSRPHQPIEHAAGLLLPHVGHRLEEHRSRRAPSRVDAVRRALCEPSCVPWLRLTRCRAMLFETGP